MAPGFTPFHRGGSGAPTVCLHGITDTWRTWELVLPALERERDVLAPTLAGHAGGPPVEGEGDSALADAVERAMDAAGFDTAHLVGNSLGGYVALRLAARGRARSVVALAPAGGWAAGDAASRPSFEHFRRLRGLSRSALPHAKEIASTAEGRRRATAMIVEDPSHVTPGLVAHQIGGVAGCDGLDDLLAFADAQDTWPLDAEAITCPVRIVWGTADRLLPWPGAARRYREEWLPHADWVELEGVGHCPQLEVPTEVAQLILGVQPAG